MNLIRLIKLKKLNGELDNLNELEIIFITIFDGVNIKYFNNTHYYIKDNKIIFTKSIDSNQLWCHYKVLNYLYVYFNGNEKLVSNFVKYMINEKIGIVNIDINIGSLNQHIIKKLI